jgi:hypothetical protein
MPKHTNKREMPAAAEIQLLAMDQKEELESRIAVEMSQATETEDHLCDMTLHTEKQATLIEEQREKILKFEQVVNDTWQSEALWAV